MTHRYGTASPSHEHVGNFPAVRIPRGKADSPVIEKAPVTSQGTLVREGLSRCWPDAASATERRVAVPRRRGGRGAGLSDSRCPRQVGRGPAGGGLGRRSAELRQAGWCRSPSGTSCIPGSEGRGEGRGFGSPIPREPDRNLYGVSISARHEPFPAGTCHLPSPSDTASP